jgi:adenosylcobyric acid synthase
MLGKTVIDSAGLEGERGEYSGLGLLPIRTLINQNKISQKRLVSSENPQAGFPIEGYEIHHGRSQNLNPDETLPLFDDAKLGVVNTQYSVWGHYLHGVFDNSPWRRTWLNHLRKSRGLPSLPTGIPNYRDQRELILSSIADLVAENLDLKTILDA